MTSNPMACLTKSFGPTSGSLMLRVYAFRNKLKLVKILALFLPIYKIFSQFGVVLMFSNGTGFKEEMELYANPLSYSVFYK